MYIQSVLYVALVFFGQYSLADLSHYDKDGHHNPVFDHEAFLGPQLAQELRSHTFSHNTKKLIEIFAKIDLDSSKTLNENEMYQWVKKVSDQSIEDNSKRRWNDVNPKKHSQLSFDEYIEASYGREEDFKGTDYHERFLNYKKNDQRRWKQADLDGDQKLSYEEFKAFSFPMDYKHMKSVLVDETLEKIDKDNDGRISVDEYVADLARLENRDHDPKSDWAMKHAQEFNKHRDHDHNGYLDRAEINEWVSPTNYDPFEAETKHLFYHSDSDKDDLLTLKEVIDSQDIFVGSQATEYGKHLEHNEF